MQGIAPDAASATAASPRPRAEPLEPRSQRHLRRADRPCRRPRPGRGRAREAVPRGQRAQRPLATGQARGVCCWPRPTRASRRPSTRPPRSSRRSSATAAPTRRRSSTWSGRDPRPRPPAASDHAADALAVAICHAPRGRGSSRCARGGGRVIASLRGRVPRRRPASPSSTSAASATRSRCRPAPSPSCRAAGGEVTAAHAPARARGRAEPVRLRTAAEQVLFELLLGVSGVGPKVALAIVSGYAPDQIRRAVRRGRTPCSRASPASARSTAERIVMELKDKLDGLAAVAASGDAPDRPADGHTEARDALVGLGIHRRRGRGRAAAAGRGAPGRGARCAWRSRAPSRPERAGERGGEAPRIARRALWAPGRGGGRPLAAAAQSGRVRRPGRGSRRTSSIFIEAARARDEPLRPRAAGRAARARQDDARRRSSPTRWASRCG